MTQKLICPECGAENPEDAAFCEVCNAPLLKDAESVSTEQQHPDQDDFELLNTPEDDLPGLLHALKHDDELTSDEGMTEGEPTSHPSEDVFGPEGDQDDEEIPDWLHRVRQRANEEEDSVGEITQKISAAKESLAGDKRSTQHESFESWIQKLRNPIGSFAKEETEENTAAEDEKEVVEEEQSEPDWLQKIRKAEGKSEKYDSEKDLEEGENGLLSWLTALEDDSEELSEEGSAEESDTQEEEEGTLEEGKHQVEGDFSGITQEIAIADERQIKVIPPKLTITPEEKGQAEELTSIIMDERAPRPIRKLKRRSPLGAARFFFALLLIVSVSAALFLGQGLPNQIPSIQPHTAGFLSWTENITQDSSILLVFDYQPAFSSEINLIAKSFLKMVASRNSEISMLSSSISGPILSRQLFLQVSELDVESIKDLGYFPIGAYGAFGLGMNFSTGWALSGLPESSKPLLSGGYDGILILADTYEGARAWIEQLTVLLPDTPINIIATDQAVPMLMPYYDSGQITGMVSGLGGGAVLDNEFSQGNQTPAYWWAYQVGLLLLIVVLVIGAIYAGTQHKDEGGAA